MILQMSIEMASFSQFCDGLSIYNSIFVLTDPIDHFARLFVFCSAGWDEFEDETAGLKIGQRDGAGSTMKPTCSQ